MAKHRIGWGAGVIFLSAFIFGWAGPARAAGDWEWTAGQGWVMGAGVSRPTPKEQLAYAYEIEQKGEFMDAARQYFLLVQNFPNSQEAGIGLQRLARCLFEMENYYTSYKAIEQVILSYPSTGRLSDLLAIELSIAKKMMMSQTPDIFSTNERDARAANVRRAIEIVNSVIEHDPYGPSAAEANLVKGEGHLFIGEINAARAAFEKVRDDFSRSDFVERARLGILRCDSLVGEASLRELAEQADVVRQEETRRRRDDGWVDEFDDVENVLRQMDEVEAAKMMEQAEVYRRMGTRSGVRSSQFLYNEVARRYPNTPQAQEAQARLGDIRVPPEQGRLSRSLRSVNLNPFTWHKDPEPPWIVPQLDPEVMVMVDRGLGPISGVPESGLPQTAAAPGVRPAGLSDLASLDDGGADFSPISAAPQRAPGFIDGTSDLSELRTYSSGASRLPPVAPSPTASVSAFTSPNPLPSISESDLVMVDGDSYGAYPTTPGQYEMTGASWTAADQGGYQAGWDSDLVPAAVASAPLPELQPFYSAPPDSNPTILGSIDYNAPLSDLVGPARTLSQAPIPEYVASGYVQEPPLPDFHGGTYYAPPVSVDAYPPAPGGGWTLGQDFR
ncbi:MAG: hypothetical protein FWG74_04390 [Planctomycetes bacterium]|nr:hypothetical protein [Planctomycetota bacterium]